MKIILCFMLMVSGEDCNEVAVNEEEKPKDIVFGDIKLSPPQRKALDMSGRHLRLKRALINNQDFLWPNGMVPVKISATFSSLQKNDIRQRMRQIESISCIKFNEILDGEPVPFNYINIVSKYGCWSYVGRMYFWQKQDLSLQQDRCLYGRAPIHELLHALGIYHEQSRTDRDNYIKINWENIVAGRESNFQIASTTDSLGVSYDIKSIMHYPNWAFSKQYNPLLPTIESIDPTYTGIIGGSVMTNSDILQLNLLYKCYPTTHAPSTTSNKITKTTTEQDTSSIAKSTTTIPITTETTKQSTTRTTTTAVPTTMPTTTVPTTMITTTTVPTTMTTTAAVPTTMPTTTVQTTMITTATVPTTMQPTTTVPTTMQPTTAVPTTTTTTSKSFTIEMRKKTTITSGCIDEYYWCVASLISYCTSNALFKAKCGKLCGC